MPPTHVLSRAYPDDFGIRRVKGTHPMEYDLRVSKIGLQVVPEFVVFQTPPEPTVTYQVLRRLRWMAISAMRPD